MEVAKYFIVVLAIFAALFGIADYFYTDTPYFNNRLAEETRMPSVYEYQLNKRLGVVFKDGAVPASKAKGLLEELKNKDNKKTLGPYVSELFSGHESNSEKITILRDTLIKMDVPVGVRNAFISKFTKKSNPPTFRGALR